ncbi:hypothetical protein IHE45_03G000100 [Dioscorea alata]|uniref:Uncharacterized protein n=1 Tax=Dioscorea alata TaxID=55571 RepID=A0ACB7WI48_DIOAL|nr:hypothetical protein IHE45_03G000100 [Dioscorea alata]
MLCLPEKVNLVEKNERYQFKSKPSSQQHVILLMCFVECLVPSSSNDEQCIEEVVNNDELCPCCIRNSWNSSQVYALGSSLRINRFILYFPHLEEPMVDGTRGSLEEALTSGALNASGSHMIISAEERVHNSPL